LRSLRLISCNDVTDIGFTEAVKALPLLEELELSLCGNVGADGVYEVVGEVCPQLKRFRLSRPCFSHHRLQNMDKDALGIANMRGLCSLQLFGNHLSNKGLETILDNCPHLECLDIRQCLNIDMNETLLEKCSRIKTIKLPAYPTDDYDLKVESPGTRSPVRTNAQYTDPSWWPNQGYYIIHNDYDRSYPPLSRCRSARTSSSNRVLYNSDT